jgi:hypothetical protein
MLASSSVFDPFSVFNDALLRLMAVFLSVLAKVGLGLSAVLLAAEFILLVIVFSRLLVDDEEGILRC